MCCHHSSVVLAIGYMLAPLSYSEENLSVAARAYLVDISDMLDLQITRSVKSDDGMIC